jgi:hypothetical protein
LKKAFICYIYIYIYTYTNRSSHHPTNPLCVLRTLSARDRELADASQIKKMKEVFNIRYTFRHLFSTFDSSPRLSILRHTFVNMLHAPPCSHSHPCTVGRCTSGQPISSCKGTTRGAYLPACLPSSLSPRGFGGGWGG